MDEPDPEVIAAARSGDLGAFERLVRRYQADIWRMCLYLLHDEDLASDVTQDTFVRAFRFLGRYRGEARFTAWLLSIARHCAVDEMRRKQRRERVTERASAQPRPPATDISASLEVREAVAALDPELREPIVLIDMFGMTYAEVSRMCGAPVGTIKSRMHRARSLLAEALDVDVGGATDEG